MESLEKSVPVAEGAEDAEDTQHGKFLTFDVSGELFGISIRYVTEIIGIQPVTFVPEVPDYVKGIINLRGKVVPVIDMRLKFKKEAIPYTDRTCVVVVDIDDISIGLIVDSVAEVLTIADENIVPPPSYRTGFQNRYINGIGKVGEGVVLLLDCHRILSPDEVDSINTAAGHSPV